jgi:hypothetical protein
VEQAGVANGDRRGLFFQEIAVDPDGWHTANLIHFGHEIIKLYLCHRSGSASHLD